MKIEIDTERDSKESLAAALEMLKVLVGSSSGSSVVQSRDIFEDPSPTGGLMGMFGDDSSSTPSSVSSSESSQQSESSQPSQSGDIFSLFSDSRDETPAQGSYGGALNSVESYGQVHADDEDENKEPTTADDIMDDDSIVPY